MSKAEDDAKYRIQIQGQLEALRILANEVRLNCKRYGMPMEASAIQMMQDVLRQIRRCGNK